MPPRAKPTILLTLLTLAAFLPLLGRRDVVTSHEARVVQTARAMANAGWPWDAKPATVPAVRLGRGGHTGQMVVLEPDLAAPPLRVNPWLVPVLNDEIRLQKPPLPYWLAALSFRAAGVDWSPGLARLLPAICGALSTLLLYDLARRTIGRRAALPAALVWVSSYFVPNEFRKAMADPYLAFFALAAVWGWIRGTKPALLTFYAATALGLLAKGPPLFIHTLIPIALYHFCYRRRPPGPVWVHLIGLALLAAITLPWPLYVLKTIPNAREIWYFESVGKMTDELEPGRPFYYYLPIVLQITLPWAPLVLLAIVLPFRRRAKRRHLFPLTWFASIVLLFSLVHMKKAAYLLPAMPAAALMTAQAIAHLAAVARRRIPRPRFTGHLAAAATIIVIAVLAVDQLVRTPRDNDRSPRTAAAFIKGELDQQRGTTVMPDTLPPEATLYLPADIRYDPFAPRLLYLLDDPKGRAATDPAAFQKRVPARTITAVDAYKLPGDRRYKLFRLTLAPGPAKTLAAAPPASP